jgi:hypothetical protein
METSTRVRKMRWKYPSTSKAPEKPDEMMSQVLMEMRCWEDRVLGGQGADEMELMPSS